MPSEFFWPFSGSFFLYPPPPCRNFDPDLPNVYILISCNIQISDPLPPKIFQRLLWMAPYAHSDTTELYYYMYIQIYSEKTNKNQIGICLQQTINENDFYYFVLKICITASFENVRNLPFL